jgi:polysaccharide biosynthesis transport protein
VSVAEWMRILARSWYLLVLGGLLGGAAVVWATRAQTKEYRTSTRLEVAPAADLVGPDEVAGVLNALKKRAIVTAFAKIVGSDPVLARAGERVDLRSPRSQGYRVVAAAEPETSVIGLEVDGPDASVVAALTASVAEEAVGEIERYYWTYSLRRLVVPRVPRDPVRPLPRRDLPVGAGVGAGVGLLLGVARDRWR